MAVLLEEFADGWVKKFGNVSDCPKSRFFLLQVRVLQVNTLHALSSYSVMNKNIQG
jgi:hypothetical protein